MSSIGIQVSGRLSDGNKSVLFQPECPTEISWFSIYNASGAFITITVDLYFRQFLNGVAEKFATIELDEGEFAHIFSEGETKLLDAYDAIEAQIFGYASPYMHFTISGKPV